MDVLIAGCGYVGRSLAARLSARGVDIVGLRRRPPADDPLLMKWIAADLSAEDGLAELTELPRRIVYAAAAGSYDDEAYRRAYVEGPRRLLERCGELGGLPERFVLVSSTGVYAQTDGSVVDEHSPTEPTGFSGKRLLEGEELLRASGTQAIVFRCGGIYGPGRRHTIDVFLRGEARLDGDEPSYTNRIHRDDVAGALLHLLDLEEPEEIYLGVDHDAASRDDVWRWLAVETGKPIPPKREGDAPPRRHGGSKRCRNDRLVESGYEFRYPTFREGFRALLKG